MSEDLSIVFSANGRSLALLVQGASVRQMGGKPDEDPLRVVIAADTGSFKGSVGAFMWLYELEHLKNILVDMSRKVGKEAEAQFSSLEPALYIAFATSRTGGLVLNVEICEGPVLENHLAFVIQADQSYLTSWLEQIAHVLEYVTQQAARPLRQPEHS
ncbi:MAG: hypothetical protein M3437_07165 [Chloroflexota bacterium]|nr:hypothetical protein [Chloroflexota bacterium]MDQ5867903.1 hypothetical protein [Chloroflexota bacterium]